MLEAVKKLNLRAKKENWKRPPVRTFEMLLTSSGNKFLNHIALK
jgi:hypothetical protein